MAIFWSQEGKKAVSGERSLSLGELVKPFGRKYKGMWRIFGVSENDEILLVSDENIGELKLVGKEGYNSGIDQLDQLCIDTIKSSKVAAVRSLTILDLSRIRKYYEELWPCLKKDDYWLASDYISGTVFWEKGMYVMCNRFLNHRALIFYDGSECGEKLGVRAIVTLRKNVEFHKTKDGYWKI